MHRRLSTVTETERDDATRAAGVLGAHAVVIESCAVPTDDDTPLHTDIYHPQDEARGPVILTRTPYGRANFAAQGIYFASHGYHCVIQDTRGPSSWFHEKDDGRVTGAWISRQPWSNGALGLFGYSYMGLAAYATAAGAPAGLGALAISAYSSDRVSAWYPGGSFGLDLALSWGSLQNTADGDDPTDRPSGDPAAALAEAPRDITAAGFLTLPLSVADKAYAGQEIPFYQERLRHGPDDPHWAPLDFSGLLTDGTLPPTLLVNGWYDYHRPHMWHDFARLQHSRPGDRMITGPWSHLIDPIRSNREVLAWFDRHLRPEQGDGTSDASVTVYVTPDTGWRNFASWPAPDTRLRSWYLGAGGTLNTEAPGDDAGLVDAYVYDPADPTPAVALASFAPPDLMASTDNRPLEARSDVLVHTSSPLEAPLTLLGEVSVDLWVDSSSPHTDFFARITDVQPDGCSLRIAETLIRLSDEKRLADGSGPLHISLDLGTVAHRLDAGHRLRLQVSSGAHPFYARNLGTGEPLASGTRMVPAQQTLHYGAASCPSRVTVRCGSEAD